MQVHDYQNVKSAIHIQELLKYDGIEFIYCLYRTFLQRDPDPDGLMHFNGRLEEGHTKRQVLLDLINSHEGKELSINIKGQDAYTADSTLVKLKKQIKALKSKISKEQSQETRIFIESNSEAKNSVLSKEEMAVAEIYNKNVAIILETYKRANPEIKTLWFDLTTSMQWHGGVVGIIRAEFEIAAGLYKLNPSIRYSMLRGQVFEEIPYSELMWLFNAENVADAYIQHSGKAPAGINKVITLPNKSDSFHPYSKNAIVFSAG